ncbi:hypothetical protein CC80DRAFT_478378 [Byssothecium circinans]|uniref:Elongation factor 1 alpha-like protein n=1 Tax=Byssothecium circinans TaxID=147558 RepID=A0A6A5TQD3_9PLEO|nr:hypothetical protein CC80DRAFT_478378 [Byssothecium circinans]
MFGAVKSFAVDSTSAGYATRHVSPAIVSERQLHMSINNTSAQFTQTCFDTHDPREHPRTAPRRANEQAIPTATMPPKSGHHRAKNIGYDDDDLYSDEDEYYEEDGGGADMTEDDKEQMAAATIQVKEALGGSLSVTDAQIQEALWHYYYDVGKSVIYLKNKYTPKAPTQPKEAQKPASRFDQAANAAGAGAPTGKHSLCHVQSSTCAALSQTNTDLLYPGASLAIMPNEYISAKTRNFFWDTPWGGVEQQRLGIIVEPVRPRGGLLGGSKLAALAAKRKQKQQEQALKADGTSDADQAVALLDKLSVTRDQPTTTAPDIPKPAARYQRKRSPSPEPLKQESEEEELAPEPVKPAIEFPDLRAKPSMFAETLCCGDGDQKQPQIEGISSFDVPYSRLSKFRASNPWDGPSPDDVTGPPKAKTPKKTRDEARDEGLAESVDKLTVDNTPKVKSKNLNVPQEFANSSMKKVSNFVVIGHVDHGKSTLMGRLLYDMKVVDQRSVEKLRKEAETIGKSSFALAWVMDQTSEERSRGVTVDIATNNFETTNTRFTILDAPGHRDFIPNMIAGASQADFAVLVIDASTNSFESGLKGQTKEHALLVRSMGVQRLVIAVNKMDTVGWSAQRFNEISQQMTAFLVSANFSAKLITFVPVAGLTGGNVAKRIEDLEAEWYKGPTLVEALDSTEPPARLVDKSLRLTIADVFRGGITNPVSVSGRIDAGNVQIGDVLLAMPSNEKAVVKAIEVEQGEPVDWAVAGQIPTLHLQGIDPIHLRLGDILCDPTNPMRLIKSFTTKILAFEHVLPSSVDVFRGRLWAVGRITKLSAILNKTGKAEVVRKKPRIVKPGEVARVVVELERELPLERGVRVVLREGGSTVAAGLLE